MWTFYPVLCMFVAKDYFIDVGGGGAEMCFQDVGFLHFPASFYQFFLTAVVEVETFDCRCL